MTNVNFNGFKDPESYAKQYAAQNNLSLDEAKSELKSKFGDPKQQNVSIFDGADAKGGNNTTALNSEDITQLNSLLAELESIAKELGVNIDGNFTEFNGENDISAEKLQLLFALKSKMDKSADMTSLKTDPNTFLQQYANENSLTLDQAKAELKKLFGEPRQ